jgi:hypothetical protein
MATLRIAHIFIRADFLYSVLLSVAGAFIPNLELLYKGAPVRTVLQQCNDVQSKRANFPHLRSAYSTISIRTPKYMKGTKKITFGTQDEERRGLDELFWTLLWGI